MNAEPAAIERVVQPFVQVDSSLARRHEGTGLGLSLVKAMAELHGGRPELVSTVGEGTTASVVLPPERIVSDDAPSVRNSEQAGNEAAAA